MGWTSLMRFALHSPLVGCGRLNCQIAPMARVPCSCSASAGAAGTYAIFLETANAELLRSIKGMATALRLKQAMKNCSVVAKLSCRNRSMEFSYVVEFKTAAGEALAISIPRSETAVIRHGAIVFRAATVTFDGYLETPLWAQVDLHLMDAPHSHCYGWTILNLSKDQA
jgi:hypothetical protein